MIVQKKTFADLVLALAMASHDLAEAADALYSFDPESGGGAQEMCAVTENLVSLNCRISQMERILREVMSKNRKRLRVSGIRVVHLR